MVKFHYYADTDSLEVSPGVVIDLDSEHRIVGIDIEDASKVVDLSCLEAEALPIA